MPCSLSQSWQELVQGSQMNLRVPASCHLSLGGRAHSPGRPSTFCSLTLLHAPLLLPCPHWGLCSTTVCSFLRSGVCGPGSCRSPPAPTAGLRALELWR